MSYLEIALKKFEEFSTKLPEPAQKAVTWTTNEIRKITPFQHFRDNNWKQLALDILKIVAIIFAIAAVIGSCKHLAIAIGIPAVIAILGEKIASVAMAIGIVVLAVEALK